MITLINPTALTPYVGFDENQNALCLTGICAPENAHQFLDVLDRSLVSYASHAPKIATICFDMEYFNSASTRIILNLIRGVSPANVFSNQPKIVWMYEETDEEMEDAGKLMEQITERAFTYVQKKALLN